MGVSGEAMQKFAEGFPPILATRGGVLAPALGALLGEEPRKS